MNNDDLLANILVSSNSHAADLAKLQEPIGQPFGMLGHFFRLLPLAACFGVIFLEHSQPLYFFSCLILWFSIECVLQIMALQKKVEALIRITVSRPEPLDAAGSAQDRPR